MIAHTTRTWSTLAPLTLDGAVLSVERHVVTIRCARQNGQDTLTAEMDGRPCPLQWAVSAVTAAQECGKCELVSEDRWTEAATLSKSEASKLHRDLALIGVSNAYRWASDTLGRRVDSLTDLTHEDVDLIWSRVRGEYEGVA